MAYHDLDNNVMKLTLLVLSCFVCVSKQERYVWPFSMHPSQAVYKPLYYSDGLPAGYDVVKKSDEIHQDEDIIPRNLGAVLPQQNRFFVNANGIKLFTTTTTITSTITSAVTTAAVVNCIPASQLSATTGCARRRRDTAEKVLIGNDDIAIKPAPPQPLETSVISDDVQSLTPSVALPDIVSSQRELEPSTGDFSAQQRRTALTRTVSTTSYSTTFVFVATPITSTTSLGIASGLLCLPSGFSICT